MNILLVNPARLDENGNPVKYKKAYLPPLSLAIINSLTPEKHNVRVINDIVEEIDFAKSYDLVGITGMTSQIKRGYMIADSFRNLGVKVVIGGIHATVLPDEAKEHADSVVIGEADNIWEQVLDDFENKCNKDFYKDTSYPDLQKLIIPKWDNFNFNIYPKPVKQNKPMMPIFITRGCVFDCKFCSVSKYFGKKYRHKPIQNVIKEIEATNATSYFFIDDNIVCNPEYSRELFKELSKRRINWFSQVSTTILKNPDLIDLASKSGCNSLFIGIESLNSNTLKSINKGFNKIEQYEELFARMRKVGIKPAPSVIFGFDDDTKEQFRLTIDFLMKNKVGNAFFVILTPLPGTDIFKEMHQQGRILTYDWAKYDLFHIVFKPKNFTTDELKKYYWEAYKEFFSYKNIAKRILYSVPISKDPMAQFLKMLFYQIYFARRKVYSHDHPLSGGVGRIVR